ncbi:MAG: MBL fold metallo-hydrolase [Fibromonadaceae bacterium]|jgi:beta-lactamase superfamily II metal-dependent hydrolase|nr:MBL fold metallo-hydrolase [Fibromonadaceae bacterium]
MRNLLNQLIIGIVGILTIACTSGSLENQEKLHIEMLNVGQGLAFLIKGKNCTSLYDTGPPNSGIDTMLQNRSIKTLCSIILSHDHNDHTGGLSDLDKMAKNGEIRINRVIFSDELFRGDTLADFLPWTARILFPLQNHTLTGNASSVAMRLSDAQNSFLFMGDLEAEQEKSLLELEPLLSVTALQVGHHGSKTSSSWSFLAQIQPEIALISAGRNNSYGHPHPETLAKLSLILQDSTQIFRTDTEGSIKIEWAYGIGMWSN